MAVRTRFLGDMASGCAGTIFKTLHYELLAVRTQPQGVEMGDFPSHLHQQKARIWASGCEDTATGGTCNLMLNTGYFLLAT